MPMSPGEMMAANADQQSPAAPPEGGQAASAPDENPVIDALRTLALYTAKAAEAQDPAAAELQTLLSQIVTLIGNKSQQGAPPPEGEMATPPPQGMPQDKPMADGGGGGVPAMRGMSGGRRAQSGQVSVI
jgi:hypothetical protein